MQSDGGIGVRAGQELRRAKPGASGGARPAARSRHRLALERTLSWADEAARQDDFEQARAWLDMIVAMGDRLPAEYADKHSYWIRRAADSRA